MIEGAVDTVNTLQHTMNLKIGTTTGYTKDMLDVIKPLAAEAGYIPDSYVAAGRGYLTLLFHCTTAPQCIICIISVRKDSAHQYRTHTHCLFQIVRNIKK